MPLIIILLALLTGCAGEPIFTPVEVAVPVTTPCHAPTVTPPDFPLQHVAATASLFVKTRAALAELDLRQAYEAELRAAAEACR